MKLRFLNNHRRGEGAQDFLQKMERERRLLIERGLSTALHISNILFFSINALYSAKLSFPVLLFLLPNLDI